ncbi:hypothetical protein L7F22_023189 [Adiantum nelumboides]|nr:hypothetical protein [Adiantum nelumboides]
MADNNIDVFKMFAAEDRLDGDNYPMWAYMMQHVLVSKGVWNIVQGIDVRKHTELGEDEGSSRQSMHEPAHPLHPNELAQLRPLTQEHVASCKSTSGFCFMLGSSCISWLSKKQPTVATSSCEAEYRAIFTATVECVWLRRLMADLGVGQDTANIIYTDSQSALAVARNPVFHARTKHIEVHYHYVRERLSAGEISLAYVPT